MTALLDAEAIVAAERGRAAFVPSLDPAEPVAIAASSASELLEAVERAADPVMAAQRASFVERLLERVDVVAFDGPAARMRARLQAAGATADSRALDVAAIAMSRGWRIVTTNGRYEGIPGIDVVRI